MKTKFEKLILEVYYQGLSDELKSKDNLEYVTKAYETGRARAYSVMCSKRATNYDDDYEETEEEIVGKILLKD